MARPEKRMRPKEHSIDAKMTILGFIGFTVLAGVFFVVGLYGVGPMIRSRTQEHAVPPPSPRYVQPQTPNSPTAPPAQTLDTPAIDLEVRERSQEQGQRQTPEATQSQPPGTAEVASQAKPDVPATTPSSEAANTPQARPSHAPSPGNTLERPRAAMETQATSRPAYADKRIYRVQAGTFSNRDNAERLAADLRRDGYHVEIRSSESDGRTLHRVQVGGYASRESADKLVNDLNSKGYPSAVVEEKPAD